MNQIIYIYGICHPKTSELRYVGKTNNLSRRITGHKHSAVTKHSHCYVSVWLNSLYAKNLIPEYFILEQCTEQDWEEAERFWIAYFKSIGANLANHTEGGEAHVLYGNKLSIGRKHTEAAKARISTLAKERGPLVREHRVKVIAAGKKTLSNWLAKSSAEERKSRTIKMLATRRNHFTAEEWSAKIKTAKANRNPQYVGLICPICNVTYTVHFYIRNKKKTCSRQCAGVLCAKSSHCASWPRGKDGRILPKSQQ